MAGTDGFVDAAKDEIWRRLRMHLENDLWDGAPLRVGHAAFVVTLDVHAELAGRGTDLVTRLRAAWANPRGLTFRVKRRGALDGLATLLGAQDVQVGDPPFDHAFVLRTNDPDRLRALLADDALRTELLASAAEIVEVRPDEGWFGPEFPDGVDELYLEAPGRIAAVAEVERLYAVFATLLDRLTLLGVAPPEEPDVTL